MHAHTPRGQTGRGIGQRHAAAPWRAAAWQTEAQGGPVRTSENRRGSRTEHAPPSPAVRRGTECRRSTDHSGGWGWPQRGPSTPLNLSHVVPRRERMSFVFRVGSQGPANARAHAGGRRGGAPPAASLSAASPADSLQPCPAPRAEPQLGGNAGVRGEGDLAHKSGADQARGGRRHAVSLVAAGPEPRAGQAGQAALRAQDLGGHAAAHPTQVPDVIVRAKVFRRAQGSTQCHKCLRRG